mgnify:CR=1 FL=1
MADMTDKTKAEYAKLAGHFIYERIGKHGKRATAKTLRDALLACAGEYRPVYWRKLRCALAYAQDFGGFKETAAELRALKNPITKDGDLTKIKQKERRVKSISMDDEVKLINCVAERGDRQLFAALFIVTTTGVRPTEIKDLAVVDGVLVVKGAKQSHGGQRGADRRLQFDADTTRKLAACIGTLKGGDVGPLQDRLRRVCKALWPRRQAVPTLYTWRHQMGGDLKASGRSRQEVAYIMGHQATDSVDSYGNRRTARGGGVTPGIPKDVDLSAVRETHNVKGAKGYQPAKAAKPKKAAKPRKAPDSGFSM